MNKPLNRQHAHIQELFKKMKRVGDNAPFFRYILKDALKQPFTITEMYNNTVSCLSHNRDYKALNKGTQYIIIEYNSDRNIILNIYIGIKGNGRRNKGIFYDDEFNPVGYVGIGEYGIYPSNTFYMITL